MTLTDINQMIVAANDWLWTYILIAALLAAGIYFTVRTRLVQFRHIPDMLRLLGDGISHSGKSHISSFQAFCVATASRVGTGNLAGVATAIALGGPGAIFWMWIIALVGSASAFVESALAQLYKLRGKESYIGGPAYYICNGLKSRRLGMLFAVIIMITFGLLFNSVQSNTITIAMHEAYGLDRMMVGIVITILSAIAIFGGIKRIARIAGVIVPIMAIAYIAVALWVLATNIVHLPSIFSLIISDAFDLDKIASGAFGAMVMHGVRRGLFSNEAGMGSAPNAAATANVSHPAKQGLIQALSVFTDTLIICSCTAFIILLSGTDTTQGIVGIELTQSALTNAVGPLGDDFVALAILLFAFSSIVGNYSYCETNLYFLSKRRTYLTIYRSMVTAMVMWGSVAQLEIVWNLADLFMAIMALINIYAIVRLAPEALRLLVDYRQQRRNGNASPTYSCPAPEHPAWNNN